MFFSLSFCADFCTFVAPFVGGEDFIRCRQRFSKLRLNICPRRAAALRRLPVVRTFLHIRGRRRRKKRVDLPLEGTGKQSVKKIHSLSLSTISIGGDKAENRFSCVSLSGSIVGGRKKRDFLDAQTKRETYRLALGFGPLHLSPINVFAFSSVSLPHVHIDCICLWGTLMINGLKSLSRRKTRKKCTIAASGTFLAGAVRWNE